MSAPEFPFILPPDEDDPSGVASVSFEVEDIDFTLARPAETTQWIKDIISQENGKLHSLQYIFCSDQYLHRINVEYLNHDTYTDIITFPYADPPTIHGDLFISVERIRDNAARLKVSFEEELRRVMIHGVLHLCGYGDKSPSEVSIMRRKEEQALQYFPA